MIKLVCELWKWNENYVLFPCLMTAAGQRSEFSRAYRRVHHPIRLSDGFASFDEALKEGRRWARRAASHRFVQSKDGRELFRPLGLEDHTTFVREAVACSYLEHGGEPGVWRELVGWVGAPERRWHWDVMSTHAPSDDSDGTIVDSIRLVFERLERQRGTFHPTLSFACQLWKWKDKFVLFPCIEDLEHCQVLDHPLPLARGLRGFPSALKKARGVKERYRPGDPVAASMDGKEKFKPLGIKDRATFVREAVACSYEEHDSDDPHIELVGWVGVPRQRGHWGIERMGDFPLDTPMNEIIDAVREMLELMEDQRGKYKGP